jgi:hypothetical protein
MNSLFSVQSRCTSFALRPALEGELVVFQSCRRPQPDRRGRSRQRAEKTEGKIEGCGTRWCRATCLHMGWRGTEWCFWRAGYGVIYVWVRVLARAVFALLRGPVLETTP